MSSVSGLADGVVRERSGDPAWARPAQAGVAVLTAILYLWGLDRIGWANTYYAAAVLAGSKSWKAFFFGSFDAGSFVTVDKPPVSLWVMELSARLFGFSSWSMLVPEALAGVATVLVVGHLVRRPAGPVAGLVAAVVMALTPIAVVMFRYNNPDALLVLLLVLAAWALLRALETDRTRWLLVSAGLVGLAFNTKDLQAYVALPALVLTYFLFGPGGPGRRVVQLAAAGGVLLLSSLWWPLAVDLTPASSRPWIAGSTDNSVLGLVFGYNGLGRITGQEGGPGGFGHRGGGLDGAAASGSHGLSSFLGIDGGSFGGGFGGFGGQAGLLRMFNDAFGGQISWLIPLAAAGLVAGLWVVRGRPRTDLTRAAYVLWGLWLLTHMLVFSFASGIVHSYYSVAMAPAIGALVGAGLVDLWRLRSRSWFGRWLLAVVLAGTGVWGFVLLARTPGFVPGLRVAELSLAAAAAVAVLVPAARGLAGRRPRIAGRVPLVAVAVGTVALLLGPTAYALDSLTGAHGFIASAGPTVAGGPGPRGGRGGGFRAQGLDARVEAALRERASALGGGQGGIGPGALGPGGPGFGGGSSAALDAYLAQHQGSATWIVAVTSAMRAAPIELSTGRPVLDMGGFGGSDPTPTASQLQALVTSGKLRYVIVDRGFGSGGPPGSTGGVASARTAWVTGHCTPVTSVSSGLYDCSPSAGR